MVTWRSAGQNREACAPTLLAETGSRVPTPGLVAADPTAAHCAFPSLLMTHERLDAYVTALMDALG